MMTLINRIVKPKYKCIIVNWFSAQLSSIKSHLWNLASFCSTERKEKNPSASVHTSNILNIFLNTRSRTGCSERSAHQHERPWFPSNSWECAADEEADGAGAEGRQVQIKQQQRLRVYSNAALCHWSWCVCSLQVSEGITRKAKHEENVLILKVNSLWKMCIFSWLR